jgi:hypothetical protein
MDPALTPSISAPCDAIRTEPTLESGCEVSIIHVVSSPTVEVLPSMYPRATGRNMYAFAGALTVIYVAYILVDEVRKHL